jgi:hypothetical protein
MFFARSSSADALRRKNFASSFVHTNPSPTLCRTAMGTSHKASGYFVVEREVAAASEAYPCTEACRGPDAMCVTRRLSQWPASPAAAVTQPRTPTQPRLRGVAQAWAGRCGHTIGRACEFNSGETSGNHPGTIREPRAVSLCARCGATVRSDCLSRRGGAESTAAAAAEDSSRSSSS